MAEPTENELKIYYKLWKAGKDNLEIREAVKMSESVFDKNLPYFLHYARRAFKEDYRNGLAAGKPPLLELTEERRKQFLQLSSSGLSYVQVAKIMNIPLPTIMDVWFVDDPVFKAQVDTINDLMNARVQQALYKKAIGYRTTVKTVTKMKGVGEKGQPVNTTTVSKQEKIVDGDVNAQKLWLINRLPEQWSADGQVNKDGNKGTIMKMLEDETNKDALLEDAKFNEEQAAKDEKTASEANR